MKKKITIIFTLLIIAGFVYSESIGVVNTQKVINESLRGKQAKSKLENFMKTKQNYIDNLKKQIVSLERSLNSPVLNQSAREKKALELQNLKTKIKRYAEDSQKEFQVKYNKEMKKMIDEIMPIIQTIGKAKGFKVILNHNPQVPIILYADKTIDITNDVIKAYNSKYSK